MSGEGLAVSSSIRYAELTTPAPIIELDILERNISAMAQRLHAAGIGHRPHIKSHRSVAIARRQLAAGAIGITTAKLAEAEVFADAGVASILLAYPIIGADKLSRFERLHVRPDLELLTTVDSLAGARGLAAVGMRTGHPVRVLIELDGGLQRGGRQPGSDAVAFALAVQALDGIEVAGLMGYFGTIYGRRGEAELATAARAEARILEEAAQQCRRAGLAVPILSGGTSPAAMMSGQMTGVTEARAGNYVFFDASGIGLGLATEADCALRVIATVVSTPAPGRATIDAGTKTLTSDKAHHRDGFGLVVGRPDVRVVMLNEEHGFLQYDPAGPPLAIGERVELIPNHACVIPNLHPRVAGVREGRLCEWIEIDARGCSY
ncbi:alanine racemase [Paenibacillus sp. IB182496]|uniref:Alanine racemase n=1 Tax=Paenibacillus sabuli TaxID=2772509 RepID=A0A927BY79_9BACL|nr:alanine racemase [Paenibacillus sabuli]MBD2847599.1 alanine racemase [Paenibacillus sabuli]